VVAQDIQLVEMKRGWERERREWEKMLEREREAREIERRVLQSAVAEGKREAKERERENEEQERKAQREWEAEREREREEERKRARDWEEQHAETRSEEHHASQHVEAQHDESLAEARREFERELKERERQVAAWADRYHALEAHVFATSSDAEVHTKLIAGGGLGAVEARHLNGSRDQCEDGTVEAESDGEGGPGQVLYSEGGDRESEADGALSCSTSCAQCDLLKSASASMRARWARVSRCLCVNVPWQREPERER
jgi:hypothetical protein